MGGWFTELLETAKVAEGVESEKLIKYCNRWKKEYTEEGTSDDATTERCTAIISKLDDAMTK